MKENKQEAWFAIIAAIIVLFSTLINPLTSATLAFVLFLLFAVYKFLQI
jgi:hypothetical protein